MSGDHASGAQLPDCSKLAIIWKITVTLLFADKMSLSSFFDVAVFLLSSFISWLALELRQFFCNGLRGWQEIQKSKIKLPEFCPIFGDYELMFPMKLMKLLNAADCLVYSLCCLWVIKGNAEDIAVLLPMQQFYTTKMMMLIFSVIVICPHLYSACLICGVLKNKYFKEYFLSGCFQILHMRS